MGAHVFSFLSQWVGRRRYEARGMVSHAAVEFRPCAKRLHAALAPERSRTIDGAQLPRRAKLKTAATKGDTNRSIRPGPGSRDARGLRPAPATPPVPAPRPCRHIDRDARPLPAIGRAT